MTRPTPVDPTEGYLAALESALPCEPGEEMVRNHVARASHTAGSMRAARRGRVRRLALLAPALATVVGTSGVAMAGSLPHQVQGMVADAAHLLPVPIPIPHPTPTTTVPTNPAPLVFEGDPAEVEVDPPSGVPDPTHAGRPENPAPAPANTPDEEPHEGGQADVTTTETSDDGEREHHDDRREGGDDREGRRTDDHPESDRRNRDTHHERDDRDTGRDLEGADRGDARHDSDRQRDTDRDRPTSDDRVSDHRNHDRDRRHRHEDRPPQDTDNERG